MTLQRSFAIILSASVFCARIALGDVYSGEPLAEALYDLAKHAEQLSSETSSTRPFTRKDVFRLADGRLLAVTSLSRTHDGPFTIETLRVTTSKNARLSERLPKLGSVEIPTKTNSQ